MDNKDEPMMSKLFAAVFGMSTSEAKRLVADGGARIWAENWLTTTAPAQSLAV